MQVLITIEQTPSFSSPNDHSILPEYPNSDFQQIVNSQVAQGSSEGLFVIAWTCAYSNCYNTNPEDLQRSRLHLERGPTVNKVNCISWAHLPLLSADKRYVQHSGQHSSFLCHRATLLVSFCTAINCGIQWIMEYLSSPSTNQTHRQH